jgi:plastocyanin
MRRLVAILAALLGMAGPLAGCGGSSSGSNTASKTKVIHITFSGSSVTPNGARVDVKVGQKVEFVVKADTAGQIHVHSSPEKQLDYNAGTTEIQVGSFAQPGLIEVESHALDKTIVQLQVQ